MKPLLPLLLAMLLLPGCTFRPFAFREAPRPEGWPKLTPVGEIQVKQYPAYRAAVARAEDPESASDSRLFGRLFSHIKQRDIPMTAPVEMTYENEDPRTMAFLYRSTGVGETGSAEDGVEVVDVPGQTVVSIGVRGRYTHARFERRVSRLKIWLQTDSFSGGHWRATGPPRYLGYNSPFVPGFLRYGEVQIPVEPTGAPPAQ